LFLFPLNNSYFFNGTPNKDVFDSFDAITKAAKKGEVASWARWVTLVIAIAILLSSVVLSRQSEDEGIKGGATGAGERNGKVSKSVSSAKASRNRSKGGQKLRVD